MITFISIAMHQITGKGHQTINNNLLTAVNELLTFRLLPRMRDRITSWQVTVSFRMLCSIPSRKVRGGKCELFFWLKEQERLFSRLLSSPLLFKLSDVVFSSVVILLRRFSFFFFFSSFLECHCNCLCSGSFVLFRRDRASRLVCAPFKQKKTTTTSSLSTYLHGVFLLCQSIATGLDNSSEARHTKSNVELNGRSLRFTRVHRCQAILLSVCTYH